MTPPPSRFSLPFRPSLLILVALILGLAALVRRDNNHDSYSAIDSLRYTDAINASRVKVGVVFAQGDDELYYGVKLAFADSKVWVNAAKKWVQVDVVPLTTGLDVASVAQQADIARRVSRDPSYVAVVGHTTSLSASVASVSYESTNLLYIATTATDPSLTRHSFAYVFRTIPTDEELSNEAANLCRWLRAPAPSGARGADAPAVVGPAGAAAQPSSLAPITNVGILYEQIDHSEEVLKDLEDAFTQKDIAVTFEKAYDPSLNLDRDPWSLAERNREAQLEDQIDELAKSPPQMIVVVGDSAQAAIALWTALSRTTLGDVPLILMAGPLDASAFIDHTGRVMPSYPKILPVDNSPTSPPSSQDQELQPGAIYVVTDFSTAEVNLQDSYLKDHPDVVSNIRKAVTDFTTLYMQRFGGNNTPETFRLPEAFAMRGYAAGQILKQAMEESPSVAPVELRQTLKIRTFDALGRKYTFTLSGDTKGFGTYNIPVIFKRFSRQENSRR